MRDSRPERAPPNVWYRLSIVQPIKPTGRCCSAAVSSSLGVHPSSRSSLYTEIKVVLLLVIMPTESLWDSEPASYTHLRAHETRHDLVCRLQLEKKRNYSTISTFSTFPRCPVGVCWNESGGLFRSVHEAGPLAVVVGPSGAGGVRVQAAQVGALLCEGHPPVAIVGVPSVLLGTHSASVISICKNRKVDEGRKAYVQLNLITFCVACARRVHGSHA